MQDLRLALRMVTVPGVALMVGIAIHTARAGLAGLDGDDIETRPHRMRARFERRRQSRQAGAGRAAALYR